MFHKVKVKGIKHYAKFIIIIITYIFEILINARGLLKTTCVIRKGARN